MGNRWSTLKSSESVDNGSSFSSPPTTEPSQPSPVDYVLPISPEEKSKSIREMYEKIDPVEHMKPSKRLKCSESMNPGHDGSTLSSPSTMEPFQASPLDSVHPSPPTDGSESVREIDEKIDLLEPMKPSKRLKCSESMNPSHHGSIQSLPPFMEPSQLSLVHSVRPLPSMTAIELIREIYEKTDPVKQICPLMSFVENQLHIMNTPSEGASSSSAGWLETVGDGTKFAAKIIDIISTEAEKLSNSDAVEEMGIVTLKVLREVGELDWVFIGLSVAAYAVEEYLSVGSTEKEFKELLLNILELAKHSKQYSEQMFDHQREKLFNAVGTMVEGAVIFCDYLKRGKYFRFSSATTTAVQLEKINRQLRDVKDLLGLCVGLPIVKQPTMPLDFQGRKDYWQDKDVFLSHSGKQKNFVRQLYRDLTREHVSCFFDEDDNSLPLAEKFPPLIVRAAETCKVAVVVLSREFIGSKWPMLELSAFINAKNSGKNANLKLLPIFFMVSPKELSHITKDSQEWKMLEKKDDIRAKWQDALKEVRSIKGLEFGQGGNEVHLRDEVLKKVCCLLEREAPQHQSQREVASFRYWERGLMESRPKRSVPCPSQLLDFQPEGIEDQVADVKKLLNIEGSEQAIAVVTVGIGGIGKSTLAASVIQSLNLSSTDFKFSMVTIDERMPDKISHIIKLQSDIIFHFTGDVWDLQGTQGGRQKIQATMASKCCFLYIDNVVDSYYIKELLPRELLPHNPSEQQGNAYYTKTRSENPQNPMPKTKIRILITSRQNNLKPLFNIKNVVHYVRKLSKDTANKLLKGTILQGDNPATDFYEEGKINELAEACRSVPLLLSIFGNHLKDNRDVGSYDETIKALNEGNLDRYSLGGDEELLSENLMYVYDKMKDKEAQEAFLDICTYFHGWQWNLVAHIVDSATLVTLHKRMLVNKSEAATVIVHDILRLMGAKKAKDTALMNYEEFVDIKDDESKLRSVKGMCLVDRAFLTTLETRHLNAMRHSLRVLELGDNVRIDGPQCDGAFKKLRYLSVGDLKDFPFKDLSNMKQLNVFFNHSKSGMELAELPRGLKYLSHQIPYLDCNEFARLPLNNLGSLKQLIVQTERPVRLPLGVKLPVSLEHLRLNSCEQLPETSGHLYALQTLSLDHCDLKCLPLGFTQSVQLSCLSLRRCTNMISLQDNNFGSLCSLRDLNLRGCSRLEKLPADLGTLTALQNLNIGECENLRVLPENIDGLKSLKTLALDGCISLQKLPADLGMLTALEDLKIGKCENLKVLPENFGGLKSLKNLDLNGCISLQRLPDSFGNLHIKHLTLESLGSLKELPQSLGNLSCLKSLRLVSCPSLEVVPDSFVHLTNLDDFEVENCINLSALPKNFEHLCSLKKIVLSACPLLTELPDGIQALKSLVFMSVDNYSSPVNLPASFDMLSCLEELHLHGLFFSSLPDGFRELKKLKTLCIKYNCKFQTLPQDFENLTISELGLTWCDMLEGMTMDRILKLQNCYNVAIQGSTKLIERWNELKEENKNLHMLVHTSWKRDENDLDLDRARRAGLLCGKYVELDSASKKLIHHSSLSIPNNTTIAVISLQLDQTQLFQQTVDMAMERARSNCAGQLRIIYVCRRSDDSDTSNEEEDTEKIRQTLMLLPQGISFAILSTDIRRLYLIGCTIFQDPNVFDDRSGRRLLCFMADLVEDDEGHQILKDGKDVREYEISKKDWEKLPISENFDKEFEISNGIVEFINCISESKTQSPSGKCSPLPEENMVGKFIQKLKNNNMDHFSDNKAKVDHLQGKTIAIILIDHSYPECKRLQQIYHDIKHKHSNFEAIWIPPDLGVNGLSFGSYSRVIQCMPWLTLADPNSIDIHAIKNRSPRVIIIDSGGSVGNPNALSLLMSRGADAYPFTKQSLSQLDLKTSLESLFHSTGIKELNNKVIFLYAEPPCQKLKMKCALEKLVQIHGKGNYEIVYVGRFFDGILLYPESNYAESLQKTYEDATESMIWTKLSFEDMMTFWYRCKYLSDEVVQKPNLASTLNSLLKALLDEKRWLIMVDGDRMVTANGIDVVEMACESSDEKDDEVDIVMVEELGNSLKEGKCSEVVRRYFRDELNHPQHHHPLSTRKENTLRIYNKFFCDRCGRVEHYTSYGKRVHRCDDCEWDLCWNCRKEFVKEEVRTQKQ